MRHPGASRFACSSTVEINVLVFGESLDLLVEIVGLDADGAGDAFGADVIVAVAAHVDNQHAVLLARSQSRSQFLRLHAWHDAVFLMPQELRDAVTGIDDESDGDDHFHGAPSSVEAVQGGCKEIAREVSARK